MENKEICCTQCKEKKERYICEDCVSYIVGEASQAAYESGIETVERHL